MANGTINKGSLVKGGGNGGGGGGSASFPTTVTSSGSSLPATTGFVANDTFLNTTDKKIYTAQLTGYSLANDITNVGSLDVSTNEISGFSSTKYLRTERYDTTINNIDFHFKTGNDVSTSQTLLIQGRKLSFSALTSIQISNKRLQIDSSYVYDNILANTEYHIKGYISKNNDDNYYYFNGILEENGVTVTTINCVYNIVETTDVIYTYIGVFRYNNEYFNQFLGIIYGDTNFLGTILIANLSWDNGTALTEGQYLDTTNSKLIFYKDDEITEVVDLSNYKLKATTTTIDTASITVSEIKANTNYVFSNNAITDITLSGCETSFEETTIEFTTGSTAPTLTDNSGITWVDGSAPTLNASKSYIIVIFNKIGFVKEY